MSASGLERLSKTLRPGDVDGAADLGEGAVGIGAKGGDRRDADHERRGRNGSLAPIGARREIKLPRKPGEINKCPTMD